MSGRLNVRVVGLFKATSVNDYLWHGNTFQAIQGDPSSAATIIVPVDSFVAVFDRLAAISHTNAVFALDAFELLWDYRLDTSRIIYSQYTDLTSRLMALRNDIQNKYGILQDIRQAASSSRYPYLIQASVYNPTYGSFVMLDIVGRYLNRVDVFRVPAAMLALQVIGLILIFISLMADILVERQAEAISVLRSRGASNGQVTVGLVTQGIGLGMIALFVGPPLALVAVSTTIRRLLGSQAQGAINLVMSHPAQAILDVGWYALATVIVVLIALGLLCRQAVGMNILSLRHETARSSRGTAWQHLRLDGGAAIVALTAYGLSVYLVRFGDQLDLGTRTLVMAPLTNAASVFFICALMILFLRFFPFLLRLGARIVMRGRGVVSMLALVQMARSSRYAARTILLPAFAIAFMIFALVFHASQAQHITDISNYEVGADFSGDIPPDADRLSMQDEVAVYRVIPGVDSATVGYTTQGFIAGSYSDISLRVMAVDANTFGRTAIWTPQGSTQPLTSLLAQLIARRSQAIKNRLVPVIVDGAAIRKLNLGIGALFFIFLDRQVDHPVSCDVVAEVQHIPTINNSADAGNTGNDTSPAGILMDYQTYQSVFTGNSAGQGSAVGPTFLFNHIWLRTSDDPAVVAQVRVALQTKELHLDNLYDRRALINELNNDPLYLTLEAFITLGVITALLLALLGDVLASWLSVRTRLAQFHVFRSLGAAPRQIVNLSTWEQGIVHATAIILGSVFGIFLAITAIPALIFTNIPATSALDNLSNNEFYILQQVVPIQVVFPTSLGMILLALLFIFFIALASMVWVTLQPWLGQALRLNED